MHFWANGEIWSILECFYLSSFTSSAMNFFWVLGLAKGSFFAGLNQGPNYDLSKLYLLTKNCRSSENLSRKNVERMLGSSLFCSLNSLSLKYRKSLSALAPPYFLLGDTAVL